ncbi:MAG: LPXTG cell wall anchor domain-containing protein, partial [Firmicutes bacterium]|nr:LPXTG cell wall anchor domain-containing protein [Bacillota bacterium]
IITTVTEGSAYVDENNNITLIITNTPGAELPSTGGPGTHLFTIFGSILILGAGILLWRRRKTA